MTDRQWDCGFGVVVQLQAQARRITNAAKSKEYRTNLMMLNIKVTLIIVTIPIRWNLLHIAVLLEISVILHGEKLLCAVSTNIPSRTVILRPITIQEGFCEGSHRKLQCKVDRA
ncbi:MAG: hypothetical protein M0C28_47440 [Candidatus Moduliflexus flocculans]|nr:hypothetical protein [Candidatus Moduliflexus flocculans]